MRCRDTGYRLVKINKKAVAVAISAFFVAGGAAATCSDYPQGGTFSASCSGDVKVENENEDHWPPITLIVQGGTNASPLVLTGKLSLDNEAYLKVGDASRSAAFTVTDETTLGNDTYLIVQPGSRAQFAAIKMVAGKDDVYIHADKLKIGASFLTEDTGLLATGITLDEGNSHLRIGGQKDGDVQIAANTLKLGDQAGLEIRYGAAITADKKLNSNIKTIDLTSNSTGGVAITGTGQERLSFEEIKAIRRALFGADDKGALYLDKITVSDIENKELADLQGFGYVEAVATISGTTPGIDGRATGLKQLKSNQTDSADLTFTVGNSKATGFEMVGGSNKGFKLIDRSGTGKTHVLVKSGSDFTIGLDNLDPDTGKMWLSKTYGTLDGNITLDGNSSGKTDELWTDNIDLVVTGKISVTGSTGSARFGVDSGASVLVKGGVDFTNANADSKVSVTDSSLTLGENSIFQKLSLHGGELISDEGKNLTVKGALKVGPSLDNPKLSRLKAGGNLSLEGADNEISSANITVADTLKTKKALAVKSGAVVTTQKLDLSETTAALTAGGQLIINGAGAAGTVKMNKEKQLKIDDGGTVKVKFGALAQSDSALQTGVQGLDLGTYKSGRLVLTDYSGSVDNEKLKTLKTLFFGSEIGTIDFEGVSYSYGNTPPALSATKNMPTTNVTATLTGNETISGGLVNIGGITGPESGSATAKFQGGTIVTLADGVAKGKGTVAVEVDGESTVLNLGRADAPTAAGKVEGNITLTGAAEARIAKGNTFNVVGTVADGASSGTLSVGEDAKATLQKLEMTNANSKLEVAGGGALTITQDSKVANVTLSDGATFKADGKLTIADNALFRVGSPSDTQGSSAVVGKLTGKGIIFVDPDAYATSIFKVGELDAAGLASKFVAGKNGIVSVGGKDKAWVEEQMTGAGVGSYDANGIKPSTFVTDQQIKLIKVSSDFGQILVGEQYGTAGDDKELYWGDSGTADTYGLALRGKSLMIVDVNSANKLADAAGAAIVLDASAPTVRIDDTARIRLTGSLKDKTDYVLVNGATTVNQNKADGTDKAVTAGDALSFVTPNALTTSNRLVGIEKIVYGKDTQANMIVVTTKANDVTTTLPGVTGGMAGFLKDMQRAGAIDPDSANPGVRFIARALDDNNIPNARDVTKTIEGAAQAAVVGATPGMTASVSQAGANAVGGRVSQSATTGARIAAFTLDDSGRFRQDTGVSAGNAMNGLGVWLMPMYQDIDASGFKSGSFKTGYDADFKGLAFGGDYTMGNVRVGLSANVGSGDAKSSGGFNRTKNDFDFWGVSLYGGWNQGALGLSADIGYSDGESSMKQATSFTQLKADVDSKAWTLGVRGEYKIATASVDVTPYLGVRYTRLDTDSYRIKDSAGTVFQVKSDTQDLWSFPLGISFSKDIETAGGWRMKPRADLGLIANVGDREAKSRFTIPGTGVGYYSLKAEVLDRTVFDGGLGVEASRKGLTLGVRYNLQKSSNLTSHGFYGNMRYDF